MNTVNRAIALYNKVKQPSYSVELDDLMELARIRRGFFKLVGFNNETQVELYRQLLREYQGGFPISPVTFLSLNTKVLPALEREKASMEIKNDMRRLFGTVIREPNEILSRLLPLEKPEDFTRCLAYMYAFISADRKLHVVKEREPVSV